MFWPWGLDHWKYHCWDFDLRGWIREKKVRREKSLPSSSCERWSAGLPQRQIWEQKSILVRSVCHLTQNDWDPWTQPLMTLAVHTSTTTTGGCQLVAITLPSSFVFFSFVSFVLGMAETFFFFFFLVYWLGLIARSLWMCVNSDCFQNGCNAYRGPRSDMTTLSL